MASARIPLVALAVAASVLAAGCASGIRDSAGRVTAPITTDSYSVRVGDCLGKLPSESTASLQLLPCEEPHYWEAFATATLTGDDFPGNAGVREQAASACQDAFTEFVGVAAGKSKLALTMLTPTSETWTQADDRAVVCLVGNPGGGVVGTLRGTGR